MIQYILIETLNVIIANLIPPPALDEIHKAYNVAIKTRGRDHVVCICMETVFSLLTPRMNNDKTPQYSFLFDLEDAVYWSFTYLSNISHNH